MKVAVLLDHESCTATVAVRVMGCSAVCYYGMFRCLLLWGVPLFVIMGCYAVCYYGMFRYLLLWNVQLFVIVTDQALPNTVQSSYAAPCLMGNFLSFDHVLHCFKTQYRLKKTL